jgi:FkbM family methyltransferase
MRIFAKNKKNKMTIEKNNNKKLVYDVGMHIGEDTEYYLKKGYKVIAFEADPELAEYGRNKFIDAIAHGQLLIVEGAIVGSNAALSADGKVCFYKNLENTVWGTVVPEWSERNEHIGAKSVKICVGAVDFEKSINDYGMPYYMKIDIEGVDTVCLEALFKQEKRPAFISIESEKKYYYKLLKEIEILEKLGYTKFQARQQQWVSRQSESIVNQDGDIEEHIFQEGASGLFGLDLPNEWLNKDEIIYKYKKIFLEYKLFGDYSYLHKFRIGKLIIRLLQKLLNRPVPGWYDTHAAHESMETFLNNNTIR